MKELKVTKESIKSFGVKCPKDWGTNQKWQEIIEGFNFIYEGLKWCGEDEYNFYGIDRSKLPWISLKQNTYNEVLTIDEAHAYLFGEEKEDVTMMGNSLDQGWADSPYDIRTTFQILTDASFKRIEEKDEVYFNKHGYYPFKMEYKIMKGAKYIWHDDDNPNEITLQICSKNGNVKSSHVLPIETVLADIKKYKR
jgi:hypothetical protein